MTRFKPLALLMALGVMTAASAQDVLSFETSEGQLNVTPVGHGSLLFDFGDKVIHVDPYSEVADYTAQPDADWVWITHDHPDHYDEVALDAIQKQETRYVMDPTSAEKFGTGERVTVMRNGDAQTLDGVTIRAVPAYNLVRGPDAESKYHPKGLYNGYLATFGDFTVYIAGDTECVPETADLGEVDLAFIPTNLPYTMPPEEAVGCIRTIAPAVVVPYHQGESDPQVVADALADTDIDVRVLALP